MFAPSVLKSFAKRLPIFGKVVLERDRLRCNVRELVSERDRLRHHYVHVASEQEKLSREHEKLACTYDELRRHCDAVVTAYDKLASECGMHPPGHFYSPIPDFADITRDASKLFNAISRDIPGIELHEADQLALLEQLRIYYDELPFPSQKTEGLRYYYENPAYSYSDAILLYCMLRHLKPRRVIEIGSGFSSCAILDTSDLFFDGSLELTLIEPDPSRLMSLIRERDRDRIRLLPRRLQDVGLNEFEALEANDILFIDSTHVSKVDSDVNRIFFGVLPTLASGVHIHFHDVIFPFEYPDDWFALGRAWNEAYVLRAFLQYNGGFRVVLMNTFMEHFHETFFREQMPLCLKNRGGSIWLRKE